MQAIRENKNDSGLKMATSTPEWTSATAANRIAVRQSMRIHLRAIVKMVLAPTLLQITLQKIADVIAVHELEWRFSQRVVPAGKRHSFVLEA
jgi:hypothetical protein